MQITVNETEYCKVKVRCEVDAETIENKKSSVIEKYKSLPVKGFRKNKAPLDVVKMFYKKEILETVKQELTEEAYSNAVLENNIKPFGQPKFDFANIDGSRFICEFSLYKQPEFQLGEYKGFEIPKPAQDISEDQFAQKILEELRNKYGTASPYSENEFVQMGDNVVLDYSASLDNQPIEALNASGEIVSVGKTPIPDFDTSLLGMKIGEEREFPVNIPEDSANKDLAGKQVFFKTKLIMGSKSNPMPLDDELAKKMGLQTIAELTQLAQSNASNRLKEISDTQIINQISRRLVSGHDFQVPSWVSVAEAQIKARTLGKKWEELQDADKERLIKSAEESVKLSLILTKIRGEEPEAQLSDQEAIELAKQQIAKTSVEPDKMLQKIVESGQLQLLMNHIKDEFVLGFIQKTCTIIE